MQIETVGQPHVAAGVLGMAEAHRATARRGAPLEGDALVHQQHRDAEQGADAHRTEEEGEQSGMPASAGCGWTG